MAAASGCARCAWLAWRPERALGGKEGDLLRCQRRSRGVGNLGNWPGCRSRRLILGREALLLLLRGDITCPRCLHRGCLIADSFNLLGRHLVGWQRVQLRFHLRRGKSGEARGHVLKGIVGAISARLSGQGRPAMASARSSP
jgi:hypothetical protein